MVEIDRPVHGCVSRILDICTRPLPIRIFLMIDRRLDEERGLAISVHLVAGIDFRPLQRVGNLIIHDEDIQETVVVPIDYRSRSTGANDARCSDISRNGVLVYLVILLYHTFRIIVEVRRQGDMGEERTVLESLLADSLYGVWNFDQPDACTVGESLCSDLLHIVRNGERRKTVAA